MVNHALLVQLTPSKLVHGLHIDVYLGLFILPRPSSSASLGISMASLVRWAHGVCWIPLLECRRGCQELCCW